MKAFNNVAKFIRWAKDSNWGKIGHETATIKAHKLRFWFFGWKLYKVYSDRTAKTFYIITKYHLPSYKYKAIIISAGLSRITNNVFVWRETK